MIQCYKLNLNNNEYGDLEWKGLEGTTEGIGNEMNDDLELCGFDNLESIVVKKDSLKNLNSLKISDNPLLKSIETEDGEYKKGAFYNVKNVTITSTLIDDWLIWSS